MADKKFLFLNTNQNQEEADATSTLALGGLTMSGEIAMGSNKITGLASGTASGDAATYGQLQAAVAGLYWTDPAAVLRMINDEDQSGTPPTAGSTGEAWVVNNWGSGYSNGDIVEWDGDSWVIIVANSGGEPPNGTRVVVIETGADGSFTGQEEAVATYSASGNTWSFDGPEDGTALIINGNGGYYADIGYTYNGTSWVEFQGTAAIVAGDGLAKSGNTLSVKAGDGIKIDTDYVAVDLTSNGGLTLTGTTPDKTLGVLVNTSAGMQLDGSGIGIDLSAAPGLEFSGGDLQVKVSGSDGLIIDGSTGTLMLELDNTPDTLDVDADGLKVVGLPALFKIDDVAVGADVTAANLDTLTDGSDADLLHTHAAYALAGHNHDGVYSLVGHDHDLDYAPLVHSHTGAGSVANTVTAHVGVTKGDPVVQHSQDNEVNKADADTEALAANVLGIALTTEIADAPVVVVCNGLAAGVLTSAVAGTRYYLASGGGLTTTAPSSGKSVVLIGWAKNATDLWVEPRYIGKRA